MVNCSSNLSKVIQNHVPSLSELQNVIETCLKSNFAEVAVDITTSPDISKTPFHFQNKGFGKGLCVAEVGGPGNLFPKVEKDKEFDLKDVCATCEMPTAGVLGPGAGPWPVVGVNCEMVADGNLKTNKFYTKIAKLAENDKGYAMDQIDSSKFSLMANLAVFESDETAEVVHFKVKQRTGITNLPETIRRGLAEHYGKDVVSMAGIFIMHEGEAKLHVMPDFPGCPWKEPSEIDKWLKYFQMKGPLVCATVFHSYDPGHKLRLEHTHCFSEHGDAGHYHYDTTPETVVYEGWLAPSNKIYRIDEI